MFLKTNDAIKESQNSTKTKYVLLKHFPEELFLRYSSPMWIRKQPQCCTTKFDEDKHYLLTPYPTLMQPLETFSPESIPAIARIPNIDLQSIGIYSKSDIQHHIRTQHFQELLTKIDTIQRQSKDQNLRKLAETAGFSDIYAQDYSEYFEDNKDGKKYRPQDISPINVFSFVNLKE